MTHDLFDQYTLDVCQQLKNLFDILNLFYFIYITDKISRCGYVCDTN
jgi:hypothetical protein